MERLTKRQMFRKKLRETLESARPKLVKTSKAISVKKITIKAKNIQRTPDVALEILTGQQLKITKAKSVKKIRHEDRLV